MINNKDIRYKRLLYHLNVVHDGKFSWQNNDFDEMMMIHENQHHSPHRDFYHCGVWNRKKDGPCTNKALVKIIPPNGIFFIVCNGHALNIAKIHKGSWPVGTMIERV